MAVQREWKDDPKGKAKLVVYDPADKSWGFVHYPLETPAGEGWVGLSEITALGGDRFALIERDNQPGAAAAIKKRHHRSRSPASSPSPTARRCRW